jgi:tetratricopeptide (TPR) repeat protein
MPPTLDWDRFTWPEAIVVFAQGLGAAHLGTLDRSRTAAARLETLENATRKSGEELFARNIGVLRLELTAWIAHVEGKGDISRALMQEAIELETSTPKAPVTPAPTLPAYEVLGDLLLDQRQPAAALAAYTHSLQLYPRRLNTLLGAARAARDSGDRDNARTFYTQVIEVAKDGQRTTALEEARAFLK